MLRTGPGLAIDHVPARRSAAGRPQCGRQPAVTRATPSNLPAAGDAVLETFDPGPPATIWSVRADALALQRTLGTNNLLGATFSIADNSEIQPLTAGDARFGLQPGMRLQFRANPTRSLLDAVYYGLQASVNGPHAFCRPDRRRRRGLFSLHANRRDHRRVQHHLGYAYSSNSKTSSSIWSASGHRWADGSGAP